MEERFPTGIMCRGQVIIAVLEKETNIGKGAMIDGVVTIIVIII